MKEVFVLRAINVLSMCDGMSGGQIALKELGIPVDNYYSFEIDKNSIKATQRNFPNTKQMGDVTKVTKEKLLLLPKIDLVMFGFPCRSLSKITVDREKYNNGLDGVSGLFYDCQKILSFIQFHNNSKVKFLIENVDTNKSEHLEIINDYLGVKPILIDSADFSAQSRKRNYWTNIEIDPVTTKCPLVLKDIMDKDVPEKYFYKQDFDFHGLDKSVAATLHINGFDMLKRVYSPNFKSPTLTATRGGHTQKKVFDNGRCRKLTPNEYRKLQTIPDWYKFDLADSHIYNMCGDGWTIEVIKHLLKNFKAEENYKFTWD